MSLFPGARLGSYEIVSQLGVGGMGEVYRARDSQLKRDVAIKILPGDVTGDAERLARFQREAEILASLNHPNIAQVFGMVESDGVRGIVMELAEGQTLAQMLAPGPLPIAEALAMARQMAEALETAHDRGIVHRDLKPANVMITPDGVVKVLDFGLAKAVNPATDATAQAATFSSPAMTRAGIILGTAAYMSPEQARGRVVDARTDIWAFGCILFEMLTGRRPFDGETVTDILGAIVHKEPDWSLLPATLPDALRRLLERCLAKDQKQRLHNIADVRLEIQDLIARPRVGGGATTVAAGDAQIAAREKVAWALAVVSLVAAASAVWLLGPARSPIADERPLRLSILHTAGGGVGIPAISPDGRRVAYPARGADGMPMIWVRDLEQSTPKALAGTEGGQQAFWSPDSKRIGFVANGGAIKHISAHGGPVQEVVRRRRSGASWAVGDVIVFSGANGRINRVSASGGEATPITTLPGPDWEHMWPSMLPDGRHFFYTVRHWAGLAESGAQGIYLGSIDNPSDTRQLLAELSSAVYAPPGYVIFAREDQLMAAPFDPGAGRVTGEPIALGESVAVDAENYMSGISAAANATLALRTPAPALFGDGAVESELTLLRRDGSVASHFGGVLQLTADMALSPDGRSVAVGVQDVRTRVSELWHFDVASGARAPLTAMRTSGGWAGSPAWSADGKRLAYACQPPGILDDVCIRDMQSGAVMTAVDSKATFDHPRDWSTDGQYMLVSHNAFGPSSNQELWVWSAKTKTLTPYVDLSIHGVFSPETRFVAFTSSDTGRDEVSVTTFPERRQTWPITTDGATVLSWSADGREILVATLSGQIVAYPVTTAGGNFSAGAPQVLIRDVGFDSQFARVSRDHSRILVRVPKDASKDRGEIRLLFGWAKRQGAQPGK